MENSNNVNYQKFNSLLLKKKGGVTVFVLAAIIIVAALSGFLYWQNKKAVAPIVSPSPFAIETSAPASRVSIPAEFASFKRLLKSEEALPAAPAVSPKVAQYQLPLKKSDIANYGQFLEKIALSEKTFSLIGKNGFAVVSAPKDFEYSLEDFSSFYSLLQNKDIPVFVTTDSLLHYYHIFFDTALMRLEKDIFYDDVWQMTKKFFDDAMDIYKNASDPLIKEAANRNISYLAVVLKLLEPQEDQIVSQKNVKDAVDCYGDEEMCVEIYNKAVENGTFALFGKKEAEKYSFEIPEFAKNLVQEEIKLINEHKGWDCSPIFRYQEDYSQYVPRGHYTKSEKLKNYFKAVMWYGRMTNLVKGSPNIELGKCHKNDDPVKYIPEFISEKDAQIQTLAALLLSNKFLADKDIQYRWSKIYAITSFFVGFSDDLGPVEYAALLKDVLGDSEISVKKISSQIEAIQKIIKEQFPKPKIYSGLGNAQLFIPFPPPLTDEQIAIVKKQADELLANTQGFRMLGQREVVDSYLFSKIVSPYSGEYRGPKDRKPFTYVVTPVGREVRGFPRGLDIMALFGSERAKEIIKELGDADYSDYEKQFNELKKEIDSLPQDTWTKNLYWNWLYVLKSLIAKFGDGYPTFMQTKTWQDKELNSALASWAELRHDTILYVKQSYTMAELGGGGGEELKVGYVEPVPEFYGRLLNLTKMTKTGLEKLLSKEELEKVGLTAALDSFDKILSRLLDISKTELDNKNLIQEDYDFIKYFGDELSYVSKNLVGAGNRQDQVDPNMFKTTLVADVHTDGNTKQVLEEGTGYLRMLIAAYKLPNNKILMGAGPIFSYYEFKHPMNDRLTDEAWREILKNNPPALPEWLKSFFVD